MNRSRHRVSERVPTFLIAGVPKAGTSSLWMHLRAHPNVYMPTTKELHYFTSQYLLRNQSGPGDSRALKAICRSWETYRDQFRTATEEAAVGEASPSTFYFSDCAPAIQSVLGDVTIIVSIRHPVERAFSNYRHLVREGRENLPFFDALRAERKRKEARWSDFWRYCDHSIYSDRLERFRSVFGKERVMVVLYEDLISETAEVIRSIYARIGVDETFSPPHLARAYNSGERRAGGFRQRLRMGPAARTARGTDVAVDQRSEEYVWSHVAQDVAKLELLLGRALDRWRKPIATARS